MNYKWILEILICKFHIKKLEFARLVISTILQKPVAQNIAFWLVNSEVISKVAFTEERFWDFQPLASFLSKNTNYQ